jgi:hypothetical protein
MAKYRSQTDYAKILNSSLEGHNLGIDNKIFIREESTQGVFAAPRIGTQGSSLGAATASTDISAGTDNELTIAVDGGSAVAVTLDETGKNTGDLIATELESKINAALTADGQDVQVWVQFVSGDAHYEVYSQATGTTSSVVITDAAANNVADDLNLGTANGGTEAAGTDDQDFLLHTTGGAQFDQPVTSSPHRSGRFHVGVIKGKKVVNFDIDTLINMSGNAGDSLSAPFRVLMKSAYGKETVTANTSIKYEQDTPNYYFTMVKASTIFAEYFTACYVKDHTMTIPGDAPGTMKFTGMGGDGSIAGIGKINGPVAASASVVLDNTPYAHIDRFTANARVMVVGSDGRTITDGYDGSLYITDVNTATDTLTLSSAIDAEDNGFIVFWDPGAVEASATENIYTDLEGSFKFETSGAEVCATNITLTNTNDHIDRTNCFGTDINQGFVAGNRLTMELSATLDLSNDNLGDLVQARQFGGFTPELVIGNTADRHLVVTAPKWIISVPPIELPENGTTPVTFAGNLYQSAPGAKDPIAVEFK